MGCGSSKQVDDTPGPAISRPVVRPGAVPSPTFNEHGGPAQHHYFDLSRQNINRALNYMAEYLSQRGANMTLIAVGGAVNCCVLRSRPTTHDLDFFTTTLSTQDIRLLRDAGAHAAARSSIPLGGNWLNNETEGFITDDVRRFLASQAAQQQPLFQDRGLTVLVAPWNYAFVAKLTRMVQPGRRRPYDLDDAVAYLREWILQHRNHAVPVGEIRDWGRTFRHLTPDEMLREVQTQYKSMYGRTAIIF